MMMIEALQMYDHFGNHIPCKLPTQSFVSMYEIACYLRNWLEKGHLAEAFAWIDNQRYILVTLRSYDVHYHGFFNNPKTTKK